MLQPQQQAYVHGIVHIFSLVQGKVLLIEDIIESFPLNHLITSNQHSIEQLTTYNIIYLPYPIEMPQFIEDGKFKRSKYKIEHENISLPP